MKAGALLRDDEEDGARRTGPRWTWAADVP